MVCSWSGRDPCGDRDPHPLWRSSAGSFRNDPGWRLPLQERHRPFVSASAGVGLHGTLGAVQLSPGPRAVRPRDRGRGQPVQSGGRAAAGLPRQTSGSGRGSQSTAADRFPRRWTPAGDRRTGRVPGRRPAPARHPPQGRLSLLRVRVRRIAWDTGSSQRALPLPSTHRPLVQPSVLRGSAQRADGRLRDVPARQGRRLD